MTGPGKPATVSSSCPSCGAGMEVDPGGRVMRCPYCRHEALISEPQPPTWPFGAGQAGPPRVTVNVAPLRVSPEDARKARRVALIVLAAVAGVFALVAWFLTSAVSGFGSNDPVEVAVGETARAQSFEATVRSVDCDKRSITKPDDPATDGDDAFPVVEKAAGKFCVVAFSVKNVGTKTERYERGALEATSPTERVLEHAGIAETYVNDPKRLVGTSLDDPIDPGKVVEVRLVYDVPVDTTLARLRIFWDLYSDTTVTVKVA